ncbi:MAG: HAD hydrolase-like protein [Bacilli bacterium]
MKQNEMLENKGIKNVIFDFNGTLIDDVDVSIDALNACITKFLGKDKVITKKDYLERFYFPVGKFYEELGFDFKIQSYDEVANFFVNYYMENCSNCKLFPSIIPLLKELKKRNINVYILSASFKDLLIKQLTEYGIENYFTYIIGMENKYAHGKYDVAAEYFAKNPIDFASTIMLGDTTHDAEVATELGVIPVLFSGGHNSEKRLKKSSNYVIDSQEKILNFIR